jgi:para-nitrobenzyl esterase
MSHKNSDFVQGLFKKVDMNRRELLRSSLIGGCTAIGSGLFGGLVGNAAVGKEKTSGYEGPVVETTAGKVRGIVRDGVYIFRGLPYAASTAGTNRFMPPRKPKPWSGVQEAFQNGNSCPQPPTALNTLILSHRPTTLEDEDCLSVNVFTPGLTSGPKRPVMVWLHGGGFVRGAGTPLGFDGTNLAHSRDVVLVAVNHRLNVFGYLYLAQAGGEKYADSGNAGMLDIVAALEWVRDNISHFGGDPDNVTVFGQSGGGAKVSVLLAMPAAKGLFHKAIVESGAHLRGMRREEAQEITQRLLAKLGLASNQVDKLQTLPVSSLLKAIDTGTGGLLPLAPVVDGHALPRNPFDPNAPEVSAEVPMMIGSVNTEETFAVNADSPLYSMDEAEMRSRLRPKLKGMTDQVVSLYRKERPEASPSYLYFLITAFPITAIVQAERKAALGKAPAYTYLFTWETPVEGGRRHSPHTIELPFVFNNVWHEPEEVGNGPDLQPLADQVSAAWTAFARTGNPNATGLPVWPAYTTKERATMIINTEWRVARDPRREMRLLMSGMSPLPNGPFL